MVVTFTFCCFAAGVLAPAGAAIAALVVFVLAAARALAVVVLVRVGVVASLIGGVRDIAAAALGVASVSFDPSVSKHGPIRKKCVQVFGCSNRQAQ